MKTPKEYAEELVGKHFVIMTNDLSFDRKRAITHAKIDIQNNIDALDSIFKSELCKSNTDAKFRLMFLTKYIFYQDILTELENF